MPYTIRPVVGGYKVAKSSNPKKTFSKKPLTKATAIRQKKAIEISENMMLRLRKHAKLHKGGMSSKHMKNMKRFIKMGDSFSKAHSKALKSA